MHPNSKQNRDYYHNIHCNNPRGDNNYNGDQKYIYWKIAYNNTLDDKSRNGIIAIASIAFKFNIL